ncbi:hypothetical protein BJ741DRAFT_669693 [Chytriomyces cf. hyalinus JEL632]|nr:hypothetical protein BJ741DRAFT_669693 [Chytriomyces cf. hyalinus JEL632]
MQSPYDAMHKLSTRGTAKMTKKETMDMLEIGNSIAGNERSKKHTTPTTNHSPTIHLDMLIYPEGAKSFVKKGECTLTIKGRNSCEIIERGKIIEKGITVLHYAINIPNVHAAVVIDTNNQLTIGRVAYLSEFNPFIEAVKKVTFYKIWDECMRDLDDYHVRDGNYNLSSDKYLSQEQQKEIRKADQAEKHRSKLELDNDALIAETKRKNVMQIESDLNASKDLEDRGDLRRSSRQGSSQITYAACDLKTMHQETQKPSAIRKVSDEPITLDDDSEDEGPSSKLRKIENSTSIITRSSDRVNEVVLIYPASGVNLVTLHDEDLERLKEGEFLNDSLIEFYIRFASSTHVADRNDFHCFNTFFYQQLTSKGDLQKKLTMEEAFSRVKRWTKKVNIFTRKFLIIPINERLHWYLAVVWNPGAYLKDEVSAGEDTEMVDAESSPESSKSSSDECKIFIFDSLDGRHPQVPKTVGAYLKYEAQEKLKREVVVGGVPKVHYAKVQSQLNHCDCGIFLLHYLNLMLRMPDVVAKAVINNEPLNTSEYGTLHEIRNMRYFMKDTIDELKAGALLAS